MKKQKQEKKSQKDQKKQFTKKRGFSLIEILVVATIIMVISAIGLVSYSSAQVSARDAQRAKDLENVRTVLLLYRTENGYYPLAQIQDSNRAAFSFPRRVIARIASAFVVPNVQATLDLQPIKEEDSFAKATPDPGKETPDIGKQTPTPTPPIFETAPPTATPGPIQPPEAVAYTEMTATLVSEGYLSNQKLPIDPVNNSNYYYGYSSDGATFTLTARLEKDSSVLTLTD